ncbi:ferredoxin [Asaccharospora irregularis]|uniref:Ferredoxin n=1 Tax=Asaccharospora irregularis DSM 2635 TaxID=1121321 RepID=A0A1M5KKK5_9FIRM|nr:ferredoxin [Asaccharospora irregularis]SHG52999.1 ferredoxin [Asaccharospora irregularis DSM 2635]
MKAKVDRDTCIGCGLCPSICPEVFSMDDEDKSVPIEGDIPNDAEDSAKEAEESCPVDAIEVK